TPACKGIGQVVTSPYHHCLRPECRDGDAVHAWIVWRPARWFARRHERSWTLPLQTLFMGSFAAKAGQSKATPATAAMAKSDSGVGRKLLLKSEREKCWHARDAYWPVWRAVASPAQERPTNAPKSWQSFIMPVRGNGLITFVRKREYDLFKEKIEKGEASDKDIKSHMTFSIPKEARSGPA
uniref:PWWP domain-containing protein n=1 Tax=Macrostomum lignano TaxID=282301 RepID=A0A1I8F3K2_9PLAT